VPIPDNRMISQYGLGVVNMTFIICVICVQRTKKLDVIREATPPVSRAYW
jgi:hypothetical protein